MNDAALIADLKRACSDLVDAREALAAALERERLLRVGLERLAQLGGGRSEGNWIAKDTLESVKYQSTRR
jgi:hypothetical protein